MGLADLAKATFWGAIVIFALIAFYYIFIIQGQQLIGLGAIGFLFFIAFLGMKLR